MYAEMLKAIVLAWLAAAVAQNVDQDSKLVTITQGHVRGYKNPEHDIFEFFGIPYATAPTGTKRFTAPLSPPTWTETLDAVDHGVICPQGQLFAGKTIQEDCLIANIYAPNTEESNLPVLVVVHGGAYTIGYGHGLAPQRLAGTKKIVAVTFNYRLGAHGFMCLGTPDAPGNAGLKDQVALLRWVKNNIASFGGNPEEVTISGYSAGASSVDLLMISKAAEGLFNRVIPESGANVAFWSAHTDPVKYAKDYARRLNFTNVDDLHALELFYKTTSYDILNSVNHVNYNSNQFFSPCIEKDVGEEIFMDDSPVNIIKNGQYRKVPLLYGFTDMEGLIGIDWFDDWSKAMDENFSDFLPDDLEFESDEEKEVVAQSVREFYFGDSRVGIRVIFGYINFISDVIFVYPMLRSAKMQTEAGHDSLYLYEYTFYKQFPSVAGVPDVLINKPGADHCAQTLALLEDTSEHIPEDSYTEEYRQMSATMIDLWINFITTGQPVPENSTMPAWPPITANRTPHMHLGHTIELRSTTPMDARAQLWDGIYDRYYRPPGPPVFNSGANVLSLSLGQFMVVAINLLKI